MDGGDHRRRHKAREGQRGEVRLVVNQIELAGAFENMRGVQQLPDLRHRSMDLRNKASGKRRRGCPQSPKSAVANRVTSTPRARSASVSRLVTSSQGP